MTNSFINKLRIYRFFDDFVIIYPLYTLMFERSGLDVSQISILLLVWSATSFALEIPSGVIADKYDRKTILIFAQLIRALGYLIWLVYPSFIGFLIGFVFWGVKSAFTSGTLDAYLYDGLKETGKENLYPKVLGSLKSLSFIAILFASSLASVLFSLGYSAILVLSIGALLISAFALVTAKSSKIVKSTEEVEYFSLLSEGFKEAFHNKTLLVLILISSILVGAMAIDEYFALYIDSVHISSMLVGYLFAFYSLIQAVGSLFAHKFDSKKFLWVFLVLLNLGVISVGIVGGVVGVALFMFLALVSAIGQVISNTAIQNSTKSHIRATVSSVSGFIAEVIAFSAYIVFWLIPLGNLQKGFVAYGVFIVVITLGACGLYFTNKNEKAIRLS